MKVSSSASSSSAAAEADSRAVGARDTSPSSFLSSSAAPSADSEWERSSSADSPSFSSASPAALATARSTASSAPAFSPFLVDPDPLPGLGDSGGKSRSVNNGARAAGEREADRVGEGGANDGAVGLVFLREDLMDSFEGLRARIERWTVCGDG